MLIGQQLWKKTGFGAGVTKPVKRFFLGRCNAGQQPDVLSVGRRSKVSRLQSGIDQNLRNKCAHRGACV